MEVITALVLHKVLKVMITIQCGLAYNGLSAFHSLYNFELMEFNNWSKVNYNYNGWSMGLGEKRLFLNQFLNVKYYIETEKENVINFYRGGEIVDSINVKDLMCR